MHSSNLKLLQHLLIAIALCMFFARLFGLVELSAVNTISELLIGRPVLAPALDAGSSLLGLEEIWLRIIDALVWAGVVMVVGITVLFALPPTADHSNRTA